MENRRTISETGSTSSMGIGPRGSGAGRRVAPGRLHRQPAAADRVRAGRVQPRLVLVLVRPVGRAGRERRCAQPTRVSGVIDAADAQQAAQRHEPGGLVVHQAGVLLEDLVPAAPGRVLQLEHGLRVEQVRLALAAPLVLAAGLQPPVIRAGAPRREGPGVPGRGLGGQHVEADAAEPGRGAGEAGADDLLAQPDGLEDLRPGVGGDGGDAHLGHDLQQALAQGLDQVLRGLLGGDPVQQATADHVLHGLQGQVRVDRGGAVADEQRDVVALAGVAGLHDRARPGSGSAPGSGDGARSR